MFETQTPNSGVLKGWLHKFSTVTKTENLCVFRNKSSLDCVTKNTPELCVI